MRVVGLTLGATFVTYSCNNKDREKERERERERGREGGEKKRERESRAHQVNSCGKPRFRFVQVVLYSYLLPPK